MAEGNQESRDVSDRSLARLLMAAALLLSLAAVLLFDRGNARASVFTLTNLVGPTAQSLTQGRGLTTCTEDMGTPGNPICFHAGRMPLPSLVVAAGEQLLGDRYLSVGIFKALLLLVPMEMTIWLASRSLPRSGWRRWLAASLLVLPFLLTPFLADVVNLQVEEGYAYSLMALALALVLFHRPVRWWRVAAFALAADGLYLSKSSMILAVAVLGSAFLLRLRREPTMLVTTLLLLLAAPLGWARWQHHASGRYSLGTSLDGINLHKGNDEFFLLEYPPAPGRTMDEFDSELNRGRHFADEWSFNDYHRRAALRFLREYPAATAKAAERKLVVIFVTPRKLGSAPARGTMRVIETGGIVVFRLLLWAALGVSAALLVRGPTHEPRAAGAVFLLLTGAVALPYVAGFAYTRHGSVLIYPAALLCSRALAGWATGSGRGEGLHS